MNDSPITAEKTEDEQPSLLRRIRDWAAWEFDRRIEVTLAIRLITIERFLKAAVLILGGIALLIFGHKTNIHQLAENLQQQLNLSPGSGWWRNAYQAVITQLLHLTSSKEIAIAIGAMLYGLLEAFEGIGLLLRRRWAEYLVLIATAVFLPLEIEELIRKATVFKVGALAVNLVIIVYLIWRKRLFLERPSHERADETEPVPDDLLARRTD
jgi:uncharacterized membrane protein (DUF2068 family)